MKGFNKRKLACGFAAGKRALELATDERCMNDIEHRTSYLPLLKRAISNISCERTQMIVIHDYVCELRGLR